MKDTCVIFGSFPDGRDDFNWARKDCDLWTFNESISVNAWVQWVTTVFQMHVPAIWRNPLNRNDNHHYDWLKANDAIPVYMLEKYPEVPMAQAYPLDEVIDTLLPNFTRPKNDIWDDHDGYYTSSLCYALALAIYRGYKRIEIWGVGLSLNTEYVYQRPGAAFWIGLAIGRGIDVDLHSHMFDSPLYGYQGDIFIPLETFTKRMTGLQQMRPHIDEMYGDRKPELKQAIVDLKEHKMDKDGFNKVLASYSQMITDTAALSGVIEETQYYIDKAHEMMQASGENDFRFSRTEFEQRRTGFHRMIAQAGRERSVQLVEVDKAYKRIDKAEGYKKRLQAVDAYVIELDKDIDYVVKMTGMDAKSTENLRYMNILDEQYKAAGGEKSVLVLEQAAKE